MRTIQTYVPGIEDTKYTLQRKYFALRREPFDKTFELLAKFRPAQDTVFIDIGANRGQSIVSMRLFHPDMPIVAFEPGRSIFERLKDYTSDVAQLRLVNSGLGDAPGHFDLYTPVYRGYVFDGLASTILQEAETWLSEDRIYFFDRSKLVIRREEVEIATLDSFGLRPSFVKLDVQGAEELVLRGSIETIAAHAPLILIEQSPEQQVESVLAPLGYAAYRYDGTALRRGVEGRKNAFLVPESRRADLDLLIE